MSARDSNFFMAKKKKILKQIKSYYLILGI